MSNVLSICWCGVSCNMLASKDESYYPDYSAGHQDVDPQQKEHRNNHHVGKDQFKLVDKVEHVRPFGQPVDILDHQGAKEHAPEDQPYVFRNHGASERCISTRYYIIML